MIGRIISGGQTGVDRAALDAGLRLGIPIGGWCPRGRKAEDGPIPARYPLTETTSADYRERTRMNVDEAHATLILDAVADHIHLTGGTRLTFDVAYQRGKAGGGLFLADLRDRVYVELCREWLRECAANRPGLTLNVAGPRESKRPGVYAKALAFLLDVLKPENKEATDG